VADRIGAGFSPIRKAGKLPSELCARTYDLEYGTTRWRCTTMRSGPAAGADCRRPVGDGRHRRAATELVKRLGGLVHGASFLIELTALDGRSELPGEQVHAVLKY